MRDAGPPGADSGITKAPVALASEQSLPNCLAADAINVYWTTTDGNVLSVPTGGGTPIVLAWKQGLSFGIAVDRLSARVYWARTSSSSGMVMSAAMRRRRRRPRSRARDREFGRSFELSKDRARRRRARPLS